MVQSAAYLENVSGLLPIPRDHRRGAALLFNRHVALPISEESVRAFLHDLNAGTIRNRRGQPYRPATQARYITDLKSMLLSVSDSIRFRAEVDRLFRHAAPKVERRIGGGETLTAREVRRIRRDCGERAGATVEFLVISGLRISEALSVRIADCRVGRKEVQIRVLGKGKKERTVTVTRRVYEEVVRVYSSREYLFQNHHHRSCGGRYTRQRFWQIIQKAGLLALSRPIHPHTCRHASATNLLAAGWTLRAVACHLGHARVSTTAEIYDGNVLPFRAIEKLDRSIRGR